MTTVDLNIRVLGGFEVTTGSGAAVPISLRKARGILAYLAINPFATRERLADLLWSDRGADQARASLRQALTALRREFDAADTGLLITNDDKVSLDLERVEVDAVQFERLARSIEMEDLRRATAAFRGDFLADIGIGDSAFQSWLAAEQARYREMAIEAFGRLWTLEEGQARIDLAKRLVGLEPFRDSSHLMLMKSLAEAADHGLALKAYESCRSILQRELGVSPGPEVEQFRQGIISRAAAGTASQQDQVSQVASAERRPSAPTTNDVRPPERPSIAVLPFQNIGGDPEQDYFADGIVEEIIIALSHLPSLFVIARNSSFAYKGRAVNIQTVGRELGVRYVLEGSVRKAANRLRIAAELIDADTGTHLWADRFEGELEDVFDLQDKVTGNVVGAITPRLEAAEIERTRRKPTTSLDAYDHFLRGMAELYKWSREGNTGALVQFHRAIDLDPVYAAAYGMAARTYVQRKAGAWMTDPAREVAEAEWLARNAVRLGPRDAVALAAAGFALAEVCGELADGDAYIDKAIDLNPNHAHSWMYSGWVKGMLGQTDVALDRLARAQELSSQDPHYFTYAGAVAFALFMAGRYEEALLHAEAASRHAPEFLLSQLIMASTAGLAGRPAEAQKAVARVRQIAPDLRLGTVHAIQVMLPEALERWIEGLRIAGVPE